MTGASTAIDAACCSIVLLLLVLMFLAVAETSLNRISRVKAQALADRRRSDRPRSLVRTRRASGAVRQPAAPDRHRAADGQACSRGCSPTACSGRRCRSSSSPSTSSCSSCSPRRCRRPGPCCPERAALMTARLHRVARVVPAAAVDLPRADQDDERDRPWQGPEEGPVRQRAGAARHRRGRRRRRRDRARGARADREHHRVRRHGRARGHGAATGHGRSSPRARRSPQALDLAIEHGFSRLPVSAPTTTTSSASPTRRT